MDSRWRAWSGGDKESMRERMVRVAGRGALAAAVDCRYHGERASPGAASAYDSYQQALVRCAGGLP